MYCVRVVVSEFWRFEFFGIGYVYFFECVCGGIDDVEGVFGERRRYRGGVSRSDVGDEWWDDVDEMIVCGLIIIYVWMVVRWCVILIGMWCARVSTIRRFGAAAFETFRVYFFNCFFILCVVLVYIVVLVFVINFVVLILLYFVFDCSRYVNVFESWFFGNVYTYTSLNVFVCVM